MAQKSGLKNAKKWQIMAYFWRFSIYFMATKTAVKALALLYLFFSLIDLIASLVIPDRPEQLKLVY
ncbi:hypothetical protein ATX71_05930 [Oenococcus oeni]|uniref:hypothetical protein n=1 Tax=Oenococcus oeni TaxID=1247 RepID=UPI0004D9D0D2|nr:hypothetical protein [Oenococcus oeni]KGH53754.1 hypothetical protein X325_01590 [Oenococcus oeni S11]KGH61132.1 hypothetical protein X467_02565 [Oenococcus oeni S28]KGH64726.1 hypothetical protein X294_02145 [Oenococcus oeni IOEB_CiNe]KGH69247.1 hypothetical protein X286_03330 [Oenococcus oeni IOEB_9517]KGH73739.1 hypothetical protein X282_02805 [Oenococcus oeni IOEB_0608]KGH93062.1 hypothetical protein X464_05540 [Oenococcus oeni S23]KGI01406.1 hypothetical protein X298_07900 [Oenococcu